VAVALGIELGVADGAIPGLVAVTTGVQLGGMNGVREADGNAVLKGVTVGGNTWVKTGGE